MLRAPRFVPTLGGWLKLSTCPHQELLTEVRHAPCVISLFCVLPGRWVQSAVHCQLQWPRGCCTRPGGVGGSVESCPGELVTRTAVVHLPTWLRVGRIFCIFTFWFHPISFTGAQGVPKYKIGYGRGKGWESWGRVGGHRCHFMCLYLYARYCFGYVSVRLSVRGYSPVCNCACDCVRALCVQQPGGYTSVYVASQNDHVAVLRVLATAGAALNQAAVRCSALPVF
jgi:hypothetical protein